MTTPASGSDPLNVGVVHGMDDYMRALAVRMAVFVAEGGVPYDEEFDGNDLSATHILATVDGEPAGSMRIRYFGDFAKPERLAVMPKFRRKRFGRRTVAHAVAGYGLEIMARKGFKRMYGHAVENRERFWEKLYGGHRMEQAEFECDGHRMVAMEGELPRRNDVLGLSSGPLVLIRREGEWDEPGVHDHSVGRLGTGTERA